MEEITFTDSQGNQLLGVISIPKKAKSVLIISHGFSSNKESKLYVELQNELNKIGIGTLRYDYYGHGELYCKDLKYKVTKDVTLTKCVNSLKAAISVVCNKGDYKIGLIGSSFGGLLSLIVASQNYNIHALVLKSPVTEPIEFWRQRWGNARIEKWKQEEVIHYTEHSENFELNYTFWEDLQSYDTFQIAKNISCPTLIVHGDNDATVPIKQSENFAKIINTKVNIIEGANHNYTTSTQYNEMKKLIINFLINRLPL